MQITLTTRDQFTVNDDRGRSTINITPTGEAQITVTLDIHQIIDAVGAQRLLDGVGSRAAMRHFGLAPDPELIP